MFDGLQCVQSYVKQLNFGYRTGLRAAGCTYINALATLKSSNTIEYEEKGQVILQAACASRNSGFDMSASQS